MNEKYYNLELSIMSCLLQKPELMKEVKLKDDHFIKYKSLWLFMKSFYNKFGTFDLELMMSVINNKYKFMDYIEFLIDKEPAPSVFDKYQDALIDMYYQNLEEKEKIEKIYKLSSDLYFRNLDFKSFKEKIVQIIS